MVRTFFIFLCLLLFTSSCKQRKHIGQKIIVQAPAEINKSATEIIQDALADFLEGNTPNGDFTNTSNVRQVKKLYSNRSFLPIWSSNGQWTEPGDSLFSLLESSLQFGLFPQDYHANRISELRHVLTADTGFSSAKLDAALWAEADLYLSFAFTQVLKDLKIGRIRDSVTLKKDSIMGNEFIERQLKLFEQLEHIDSFTVQLEPKHQGYHLLKAKLREFLLTADFRQYTYVDPKDSIRLNTLLWQRLKEDSLIRDSVSFDTTVLKTAIKKYQKKKTLKTDGKVSSQLIGALNQTDAEKFIRIAISLDRFKQLPDSLPARHLWVNIPGYYMLLKESDTVRLQSKVVVGKPETRTPVLSSVITDMITYPQWTIPLSIIKKDILPGLKKDPGYTRKKGFSLIGKDGVEVDPYLVDWTKYKEEIPYKVVQGSGDDNALGVMKFNFSNKYAVYLHDTNQRYLFAKKNRALSHGCVRVQNWDSLAYFFLKTDSIAGLNTPPADSLKAWLERKEKHVIPVRKRIPLFIRYFTSEVKDDELVFYEDVYGEDRKVREKYFSNKTISL